MPASFFHDFLKLKNLTYIWNIRQIVVEKVCAYRDKKVDIFVPVCSAIIIFKRYKTGENWLHIEKFKITWVIKTANDQNVDE